MRSRVTILFRRSLTIAVFAIASAALARPVAAQRGAVITGRVVSADSSLPVAGAVVSDESGVPSTITDADGRFRLAPIPPGNRALLVRHLGFARERREISVLSTDVLELEIRLRAAPAELADITVIGTRRDLEERRRQLAEIPGSVALVSAEEIRSTRQANLKDVLQFTPGVLVQPRFGAADESQISIRGSGLRNNFHARGINLLVNGMPYRNADGFTDFESLELLTTEAVEVYKGANALRFGGSTLGGAINLQTRTGYTAPRIYTWVQGGSHEYFKGHLASGGTVGRGDYYASYARTSLGGYREWSDQGRDRVNLHAGYLLSPATDVRGFYFFARVREHLPGALSEADYGTSPRQADPGNVTNRWGRDYDLHHAGLQLRASLSPTQRVEISPYFQYRDIDHPIFRVINQQSRDIGAEARYENTAAIGGRRNRFTIGFQPAHLDMDNRQFDNVGGEHGALRKDQVDRVTSLAVYGENLHALTPRLAVVAGARFEHSTRAADDNFLDDGDQTDRREFNPVSPRVGILYDLPEVTGQLYANASHTFEPPLLLELNSLAIPGFIDLEGQSAWQFEIGTRGRAGRLAWDLAAYDVELRDEILNVNVRPFPNAPFTVPTYRNSPRTRHYGVEAGMEWGTDRLRARAAYTWGRFRFVEDSLFDGNAIPGAPEHQLSGELRYTHPTGVSLTPAVEWVPGSYFVNSANTVKNRGWVLLSMRAEWQIPRTGATLFAEGRNLGNIVRSTSVQVDNAAGKYFEPGDSRALYAGFSWGR